MPSTVSGSSSAAPSETARISSSRKKALPSARATIRWTTAAAAPAPSAARTSRSAAFGVSGRSRSSSTPCSPQLMGKRSCISGRPSATTKSGGPGARAGARPRRRRSRRSPQCTSSMHDRDRALGALGLDPLDPRGAHQIAGEHGVAARACLVLAGPRDPGEIADRIDRGRRCARSNAGAELPPLLGGGLSVEDAGEAADCLPEQTERGVHRNRARAREQHLGLVIGLCDAREHLVAEPRLADAGGPAHHHRARRGLGRALVEGREHREELAIAANERRRLADERARRAGRGAHAREHVVLDHEVLGEQARGGGVEADGVALRGVELSPAALDADRPRAR